MLYILTAIAVLVLIALTSVQIRSRVVGRFELERRANDGDDAAAGTLRRESKLDDLLSLQRAVVALFVIIVALLSVVTFGWFVGIVVALAVSLASGALSRQAIIHTPSQKLYDKYELRLITFVDKAPYLFTVLRSASFAPVDDPELQSKEQLLHLVKSSVGVLSQQEKTRLVNGLSFAGKYVRDIMTPRGVIDSLDKKELLGPLVLDDLHKTGHSRFPVIDGDVDHVVGVLHIRDLLVLSSDKRSATAEKAMEPRVFYIREDQTLDHALAAFIRTHHHLFVVVNEYRETVGLLTLEDVIEALLGHAIVDEFDAHEDLRAVAARNPRGNNHPAEHTDV